MLVDYQPNVFLITFPFDKETLWFVKSLPGHRWDKKQRHWEVFPSPISFQMLSERGCQFTDRCKAALTDKVRQTRNERRRLKRLSVPDLGGVLRPFQLDGVRFLERMKGRALIGDEMGLGKTVQALAYLQLHRNLCPAIVVCPSSVKINWARELLKWIPDAYLEILEGKKNKRKTWLGDRNGQHIATIVNYNILLPQLDRLLSLKPRIAVFDECHYLKNRTAQRTAAAKEIGKETKHIIALSGTPIINRPEEFYEILRMLRPDIFDNWWWYINQFCAPEDDGHGMNTSGASDTEYLNQLLRSHVMIRRKKSDVLKELPPKTHTFVPMKLTASGWKEYLAAATDFKTWLWETEGKRLAGAETLVRMGKLRQLAAAGKALTVTEWIRDFLEVEDKLVVFGVHIAMLDTIQNAFPKITVRIDGGVASSKRQQIVDRFQNDSRARLFLGNIKAAGIGITLTAASNVAFMELPWSPGELSQASDRCHRIGQHKAVNVWYLMSEHTIEEYMYQVLIEKMKVLGQVLDGKTGKIDIMDALLRRLKQ